LKSKEEIIALLDSPYKVIERELNIKIRNGQTKEGIKKALLWVSA